MLQKLDRVKNIMTNLIMDVKNRLSVSEYKSCLFLAIRLLESFKYEIHMYKNLSSY